LLVYVAASGNLHKHCCICWQLQQHGVLCHSSLAAEAAGSGVYREPGEQHSSSLQMQYKPALLHHSCGLGAVQDDAQLLEAVFIALHCDFQGTHCCPINTTKHHHLSAW
jgi:hypothetical protein